MTGQDGRLREGGGGEYNGECLLNNDRDNDEYNNGNKTKMQRMGRGRTGEWTRGGIQLRWSRCCQQAVH
jgi:hypothetical protein